MSKAVLMSMIPKQCELVVSGEQTVVVRKTKPKLETPFKVYIYCTKDNTDIVPSRIWWKADETGFRHILNGKVTGEFMCYRVDGFNYGVHEPYGATNWQDCYKGYPEELYDMEGTCLAVKEINNYGSGRFLYAWHISNLVIYDKPKELGEFFHYCGDEPKCKGCPYLYTESDESVGIYAQCCSKEEGCKPLTRPPQSWCYVEELN